MWCADNKFLTVYEIELQRFYDRVGERLRTLEPRDVIIAVSAMFEALERESQDRQANVDGWLEEGRLALQRRRPKPGQ